MAQCRFLRDLAMLGVLAAGICSCAVVYRPNPEAPEWTPRILTHQEAVEGFYPLFDGATLDGWFPHGGSPALWTVEAGVLHAPPNALGELENCIATVLPYAHFELRFEYRSACAEAGALWMLSESVGSPCLLEKIESDPTAPHGWLAFSYVREERMAKEPAAGFLGLSGGPDGLEIRRMRILPLRGGAEWRPLFNGQDLEGWEVMGDAAFEVLPEGVLRIDGATMTRRSSLRTLEEFGDFELRLSFRPHTSANSGVFFRGRGGDAWPRSYEAQIDNNDAQWFTGAIYGLMPALELRAFDNRWNHMRIRAKDAEISVVVNGKTVVDMASSKHADYPEGWIALQGHDPDSIVDFKNIELRPLR